MQIKAETLPMVGMAAPGGSRLKFSLLTKASQTAYPVRFTFTASFAIEITLTN